MRFVTGTGNSSVLQCSRIELAGYCLDLWPQLPIQVKVVVILLLAGRMGLVDSCLADKLADGLGNRVIDTDSHSRQNCPAQTSAFSDIKRSDFLASDISFQRLVRRLPYIIGGGGIDVKRGVW